MKCLRHLVLAITLSLVIGFPSHSFAVTAEQKEIVAFIQQLYSYDPDTFEYGRFDKNDQPLRIVRDSAGSLGGKYKPLLRCELYKIFFVDALIVPEKERRWCDSIHVRYPTVLGQDLSSASRFRTLPLPKVGTPVVQGDIAKVAVMTGDGEDFPKARTLYFLTKTTNGWRITNALLHQKWPEVEEDRCIGNFLAKPTPEQRMELMPHCRD